MRFSFASSIVFPGGRHSGAEAVTIEGVRKIKITQKTGEPPKYLEHTTRIWLASEESKPETNKALLPFGWAILEIFDGFQ